MKCPHCKKPFEAPHEAIRNAECYGGSHSHVRCRKCNEPVLIRTAVRVVVEVVGKGDKDRLECW